MSDQKVRKAYVITKHGPEKPSDLVLDIISASQIVGTIMVYGVETGDIVGVQIVGGKDPGDKDLIDKITKILEIEGFAVNGQSPNGVTALKK